MGITIIPAPGSVQGAGSLTTEGALVYVASAGTITQDTSFSRSAAGRYTLYDATATTGVTTLTVRAGAGQSSTNLQEWKNNAGTTLAYVAAAGTLYSSVRIHTTGDLLLNQLGAALFTNTGDGILRLTNNAGTGWDRIQLGGTGPAHPSLKRNGALLEARLADDSAGTQIIIGTLTPASASASGVAGTIAWDANYIYVATGTNTWKRVAIATW